MLTGACGSGKTTVARLLARTGWSHVSEDAVWVELFGRDRGPFGSSEHRGKRRQVHEAVLAVITGELQRGHRVVLDATLHESPPEAFLEYAARFDELGVAWALRVLHPAVDVAIARDAARATWHVGADRVSLLHAKFTGLTFARQWFIDTSNESPDETVRRVLASCA
jgi:predicted kinase